MNITQTLRRSAQINRDGTVVVFGDRQWTYTQMQERVAKLAGALQKLGVEDDDRVAVLALASDRFVELLYGTAWAGGIVVPLNFRLAVAELIYLMNDSGAKILVLDDAFSGMLAAFDGELDKLEHVIFIGEEKTPEGMLNYEALVSEADAVGDAGRNGDDVLGIFYTGGTTGLPKGVMVTHHNMISEVMVLDHRAYLDDDPLVWLCVTPFFHVTGSIPLYNTIANAGKFVLFSKFDPLDVLKAIQAFKANTTILVPTMVGMLVNHPAIEDFDVSSMKEILYGASPMPLAIVEKAMKVFQNASLVHVYGMTETTGAVTLLEPQFHVTEGPKSRIKSAGRAVIPSEIRIVDPNDNEVPRGEVGEIVMSGALIMKGYWNKPEQTAEALRGGWMHSGDMGYMDDEGFVYIVDRLKDMIITGGENVYSVEVENAIFKHEAVAMCAVIGIPNEEWGESIHAIVMIKEGEIVAEEEIIMHCRQLIAHYKCPRSVTLTSEPLPLSGAGKVLKHLLRQPYWEGYEKGVN